LIGGECFVKEIVIFATYQDVKVVIEKILEDCAPASAGSNDKNKSHCFGEKLKKTDPFERVGHY
jgi:hypothetical protein